MVLRDHASVFFGNSSRMDHLADDLAFDHLCVNGSSIVGMRWSSEPLSAPSTDILERTELSYAALGGTVINTAMKVLPGMFDGCSIRSSLYPVLGRLTHDYQHLLSLDGSVPTLPQSRHR